jgi:hypothetical protein
MNELLVPDSFSCLDIQANNGRRKQVVAVAVSAVLVACCAFNRQI